MVEAAQDLARRNPHVDSLAAAGCHARGLIELVILNIGLERKIISPELFSILVLMALVTTFMTAPLLAFVSPRDAPG